MKPSTIIRYVTTLLALSLLCFSVSSAAPAHAEVSAPGTGWIRLAHLSPDTPAVDVYLYSFGDGNAEIVLRHVSYGMFSPYRAVPAGDYSVAMRAAGATAKSPPVLSTNVMVVTGHAYTVAGLGAAAGLRLAVLSDVLATPRGHALVRVIQASLRQHVVSVTLGGDPLVSKLTFPQVSPYRSMSPVAGIVRVAGTGQSADVHVSLAAGTIYTLVVLDGSAGLMVTELQDASGAGIAPAGDAATGLGGTAPPGAPSPLPWLALIVSGSLIAVVGGLRIRRRASR
jgi:hypothetical protein